MLTYRGKLWLIGLTCSLGFVAWLGSWALSYATAQQSSTSHPAIQYEQAPVRDAVWQLQQRLANRQLKLTRDKQFGWLPSLLHALDIPVSSQILTFGKTSFQARLISPQRPRALFQRSRFSRVYS
jgi:hypothetical protein